MTVADLRNAVTYLRRLVVGQREVDQLVRTITALESEIRRRERNHD